MFFEDKMLQKDYYQKSVQTMGKILLTIFLLWTLAIFGWYIQEEEKGISREFKYPKILPNQNRKVAKQEVINEIMENRFEKYLGWVRKNLLF